MQRQARLKAQRVASTKASGSHACAHDEVPESFRYADRHCAFNAVFAGVSRSSNDAVCTFEGELFDTESADRSRIRQDSCQSLDSFRTLNCDDGPQRCGLGNRDLALLSGIG